MNCVSLCFFVFLIPLVLRGLYWVVCYCFVCYYTMRPAFFSAFLFVFCVFEGFLRFSLVWIGFYWFFSGFLWFFAESIGFP